MNKRQKKKRFGIKPAHNSTKIGFAKVVKVSQYNQQPYHYFEIGEIVRITSNYKDLTVEDTLSCNNGRMNQIVPIQDLELGTQP